MKLDKRKVTVVKYIYIACDGKEFEDEYECMKHEHAVLERRLHFYARDFKEADLDSCMYVKLISKADVDILIQLCDFEGITRDGLEEEGIYMYEERANRWVNITEAISKICGG